MKQQIIDKRTLELILTDHEYSDIEKDGHHIAVRPVYEWQQTR